MRLPRFALPLAVIAAGLFITVVMVKLKPHTKKGEASVPAPLVEVLEVQLGSYTASVAATGLVEPARQVRLVPQVSGRVVEVAPGLQPGARLQAGALLARIDGRDYRFAVTQQESLLEQARLELELERGRQATAQREWALLGDDRDPSEAPLALRGPHLLAAEKRLAAAEASLAQARLNLERTAIRAPFAASVLDENLDVGQVVGPTSPVATVIGTARFWIHVSLPLDRLPLLDVPGVNCDGEGSIARVVHDLGSGTTVVREGRVLGLAGQLDPEARMAQLLVQVDHPLDPGEGKLPLLPGAFVDVDLSGRDVAQVATIPRVALHGDSLWLVEGSRLEPRQVQVAWSTRDDAFVTQGLQTGDQVLLTPISLPIRGMKVRVQPRAASPANGQASLEQGGGDE